MNDAAQWHNAALNLLGGRGLIVNEDLRAYRPPIPALYFATIYSIFGVSFRAVQIANIILGVVTVWLGYELVKRSFGVVSALWAGVFVSLYPTFLLYTGEMLSETPFAMLISLGLLLAWILRDRTPMWFVLIGIVLGVAVLTRVTALPIALLIVFWISLVRRSGSWWSRCVPGLVILACVLLTVVPWTVRNYLLFGKIVPLTSQGGLSLWIANNPWADGTALRFEFPEIPQVDALPEVDRGIAYQKLAVAFIVENPFHVAQLTLRRLRYFWHLGYHDGGLREIAFLAVYLPLLALAAVGAWVGWSSNRDATLLFLVVPFALSIVHMVFLPEGRYRLPAELLICLFAGNGTAWCSGRVAKRVFESCSADRWINKVEI
jgi:4-amino-4-deoxy-L-arabinose transferase-like glycosyltransferase